MNLFLLRHGIAVEPGAPTSPLRVAKNGIPFGIQLVATNATNASRFRIPTASGIKAIKKLELKWLQNKRSNNLMSKLKIMSKMFIAIKEESEDASETKRETFLKQCKTVSRMSTRQRY